MELYIVRDHDGLQALESEWNRLADLRDNPLLAYDWFYACAKAFYGQSRLHIVVAAGPAGTTAAIAPLARTGESFLTRRLEILGASQLFEPTALLHAGTDGFVEALSYLQRAGYPILLNRYWQDGHRDDALRLGESTARGRWFRRPARGSGVLDIRLDWPEFLKSLSGQRRYDCRRAERRALRFGGTRFSCLTPTDANAEELISLACEIEQRSWKGRRGSSIRANATMMTFLRAYVTAGLEKGRLRFMFLYLGGAPAAMAICAQSRDALWFVKIGYDEDFSVCSPGVLLLTKIYQYCVSQKLSRIEHLGSYEPWLSPWTSRVRPYETLIYYPYNVAGASIFARDVVSHGIRRAAKLIRR